MEIGRHHFGGEYFPGSVDDVCVYNRALTPAQVKQLYKLGTVINMPARRVVRDVNEDARDVARRKMRTKAFAK